MWWIKIREGQCSRAKGLLIFNLMRSRDLPPRLLYPAKILSRTEREIKSFPEQRKLKDFITTTPLLYEMLKGLLEEKDQNFEQ